MAALGSVDSRDLFSKLDLELAIRLRNEGNLCESLGILGRGLHSVQDRIAHGSRPFFIPHPAWVDDPLQRPEALTATEIATKAYLKLFLKGNR